MVLKNFIVFEGIDGSGKSTVINALNQKLHEYFLKNNLSIDLIQTREPGGYNNLLACFMKVLQE